MPENNIQKYQPELLPRRGEWIAWLLTLASGVGIWLWGRNENIPGWMGMFSGFLAFSAVSISLGNWLDRNTTIWLEQGGIRFENGLRRVQLNWREIREVAVLPTRWGKSVHVIGEKSHFGFKTLGEMRFRGEVRSRTGFTQGQEILDVILCQTGLTLVEESNNAYYYARG